jgi:hypothetical protein
MESRISEDTKMKTTIKLAIATAALATGTLFVVPAGLAFGNAPWSRRWGAVTRAERHRRQSRIL